MTRDPLVLLVVGFLLTSVAGGTLGYTFQRRSWRHQYRAQRDDHQREQALTTFEEVSTQLDRRLYRMRRVYWAARARALTVSDNAALNTELDDYRDSMRTWNDNLNRTLALVDTYFGEAARAHLEHTLYERYAAIGRELDRFVREVSVRGEEPVPVRPIGRRLSALGNEVYRFNIRLLRLLRDNQLGPRAPQSPPDPSPARRTPQFGDLGGDVRTLQESLRRKGFELTIDGHFGVDTERAVIGFQRSAGLDPDGIAGQDTRRALDDG
jgi:hypothetical protein